MLANFNYSDGDIRGNTRRNTTTKPASKQHQPNRKLWEDHLNRHRHYCKLLGATAPAVFLQWLSNMKSIFGLQLGNLRRHESGATQRHCLADHRIDSITKYSPKMKSQETCYLASLIRTKLAAAAESCQSRQWYCRLTSLTRGISEYRWTISGKY